MRSRILAAALVLAACHSPVAAFQLPTPAPHLGHLLAADF